MSHAMKQAARFDASRRMFLRHGAVYSALAGAGAPLAMSLAALGTAHAQAASDYRALVCIFLFGGNDAYNMVLPTDTASFANYTAVRNQAPDSIALLAPGTAPNAGAAVGTPARLGGALAIMPSNAQGRTFALHPLMGSLQTLFNTDRRLAIVPNVGPLVIPTNKQQYGQSTHPKPISLFSHNDQQNTWQALAPEGATQGWGGRLADMLMSRNTRPVFTAVSSSGSAVWLAGASVRQYQVSTNGAIRMGVDGNGRIYNSADVGAAMQRIVSRSRGAHVFEADMAAVAGRSLDAELALRGALKAASDPLFGTPPASGTYNANTDPRLTYANPLTGANAANPLAQQLQIVARMIDAAGHADIAANRQVFFVSMGGFDTHDAQNRSQADLMARLAHGLAYFDATLGLIGARNRVTTFTASDFGRTFTSNGDGTDHGWGSHHFVMGGAVRGGDLYGMFPVLGTKNANNNNFDSSPDQLGNGALLPKTGVQQLGATLGRWFGASESELLDVFPRLNEFPTGNLGFMV
jgi:uncharacterized protein (DUF1501 family)